MMAEVDASLGYRGVKNIVDQHLKKPVIKMYPQVEESNEKTAWVVVVDQATQDTWDGKRTEDAEIELFFKEPKNFYNDAQAQD